MLRRVFTPDAEHDAEHDGMVQEDLEEAQPEEEASSQGNHSTPPYSPLPEFEDLESC